MFEGVGLVVPLEISLKDPSKFRFLFSSIVYIFSVFCMIIGVLVSPVLPPAIFSTSSAPTVIVLIPIPQGFVAFGDSVQGSITNALPSSVPVAVNWSFRLSI